MSPEMVRWLLGSAGYAVVVAAILALYAVSKHNDRRRDPEPCDRCHTRGCHGECPAVPAGGAR